MAINFINPYTFVPLEQKPDRPQNQSSEEKNENSQVSQREEDDSKDLLTGKIVYTLHNISPLFIPNTENDHAIKDSENGEDGHDSKAVDNDHKSYEFFSYENTVGTHKPVIPGSEIRGMVRSIYEAMTNSCMSVVDRNMNFSKRVDERMKPGILMWENGKLVLYTAINQYRVREGENFSVKKYRNIDDIQDGSIVRFIVRRNSGGIPLAEIAENGRGTEGYLLKGNDGPEMKKPTEPYKWRKHEERFCSRCPEITKNECGSNSKNDCFFLEKHCAHIFSRRIPFGSNDRIDLDSDDIIRRMNILLQIYKKNKKDAEIGYGEYQATWNTFISQRIHGSGIPVYYSNVEDIFYLSPACISREVYQTTLDRLLGAYIRCEKKENLCPACTLFGTIASNCKRASKVRFADADFVSLEGVSIETPWSGCYDEPITMYELSTPSPSATEFYLHRPEAIEGNVTNWTYDYYCYEDSSRNIEVEKTDNPRIAGRKFYWHNPSMAVKMREAKNITKTDRNHTVRPLKMGCIFRGELYFENISCNQLEELLGILNMSSNREDNMTLAAKLGAGKPLGFGSVELKVEDIILRHFTDGRYTTEHNKPSDYSGHRNKLSKIEKIFQIDAVEKKEVNIVYPVAENQSLMEEGFKWFEQNRKASKSYPSSRKDIKYKKYMVPMETVLRNV